jgi:cell division protein FtsL
MRLNILILVFAMFVLGTGVFSVADKVTLAEKKLNRIERKIAREQESLRVLNAEWTYLTSPTRLEKLAQSHLQIAPIDGGQYIELAAVPMRDFIEKQIQQEAESGETIDQAAMTPAAQPTALPVAKSVLPVLTATPISVTAGGVQ